MKQQLAKLKARYKTLDNEYLEVVLKEEEKQHLLEQLESEGLTCASLPLRLLRLSATGDIAPSVQQVLAAPNTFSLVDLDSLLPEPGNTEGNGG